MRKPRDLIARTGRNAQWDGAFEALEQRVLLSSYQTEMFTWYGQQLEVVEDSWILTFTGRQTNEQAIARTQQVAAALGVPVDAVEPIGRGMWARLRTPGTLTEGAVQAVVQQMPFLRGFQPETVARPTLVPNDPMFADQWPHQNLGQFIPGSGQGLAGADIKSTFAWDTQTGSRQVVIAVLDTGTDLVHPDLVDNLWRNPGEIPGNGIDDDGNGFIDDVFGWDAADNDNNPQDQPPGVESRGHGTAVAGVIGAVGNNGIGVAGVAWQVSIMTLKIFPDNQGTTPLGAQLAALDYVAMMKTEFGVNIVATNNSYGGLQASGSDFWDIAMEVAIQQTTDAGILFVAAAGNETNDNDGQLQAYPASYTNPFIISVAATDNRDQLADFSNWGLTSVDLGAPGVRTLTTAVDGGYDFIDGTSFASPYTAGVVALLASASPFATAQQIRDAILSTVDPVPALAGKTVTGGRLNALEALRAIGFPGPVVQAISPGTVSGPVSQITIAFSEPIDPAVFDASGIILRRANGDGLFNGNDITIAIPNSAVEIDGAVMRITIPTGTLPADLYRLTLSHQVIRDFEGNFLNGTTESGNDEVYTFRIVAGGGPLEPNDSIAQATTVILDSRGTASFTGIVIGDGANATRDVDIYRLTLSGPGLITVQVDARNLPIPSTLDSVLRLFDASGRELAINDNFNGLDSRLQFFVPAGGRYYVGVSGFGNSAYNPAQVATGTPGGSTGVYNITFHVDEAASEGITYASGDGPIPIPAQGTITSRIFVPDVRAVQDLNVRVNIQHSYVGDLRIYLTSPTGVMIPLVLNRGGAGDDFIDTVFDDEATQPISAGTAPFTGSFRPEGELEAVDRISAEGWWTLTVVDTAPLNSGTLLGWALEMTLDNAISGPYEFNDTIATATDTQLNGTGTTAFEARVGDGAFGRRDVDLYRFTAQAGTTVTATVTVKPTGPNAAPNLLDAVLRLFDAQGNELLIDARLDSPNATITFPVQFAGTYYLGVSGGSNQGYDPAVGGSGVNSEATGDYTLVVQIVGGVTDQPVVLEGDILKVGVGQDGTIGGGAAGGVGLRRGDVEFVAAADSPIVESFYGATFNGFVFRNAGSRQSDLPVSLANQSDFSNKRLVVEGLFRATVPQPDANGGLLVRRALSFGNGDGFVAVDVSLTNTTFLTMDNVGWVEGFRPTQAVNLGSPFTRTFNNVDNSTGRLVTSTYFGEGAPGGVTFGIGAPQPGGGASVVVSVEQPDSVRDAFQVVNSPVDPDPGTFDTGVEMDGLLTVGFDIGAIAPGATVTVRYFIFTGDTPAQVREQFEAMEDGAGTKHLVADPADPSIAAENLPYAAYYPEGYANSRASTFLPLNNPHHIPARVVVIARYEDPALEPTVLFDGAVAAMSRGGVTITTPELYAAGQQLVHKDTPYAVEVLSSLPIGATLSHFDFGISTGQAFTSEKSTTWTFSEGFKGSGVSDFLVFYNTTDQPVKVTLTIYPETGDAFIPQMTQEVGPRRRGGWDLSSTSFIPNGPFAMRLDAEAPIVAALTHFDTNLGGGFAVLGLPGEGATRGVSPEGQLGLNSQTEFVTVLNTGTQPSEVTFTFLFANQSAFRQRILVQPGRRSGFSVGDLPGFPKLNQPYSVSYEASAPVSVTLSSFAFGAGAATRFTDQAHTYWLFSEGFRPGQGSAVTEYLRLFSSSLEPVTVEISIDFAPAPEFGDLGGRETFRRVLTPRAANDFDIHEFITGARAERDTFYSVTVKAPTPITAYAGRYDAFLQGGLGTLGTPLGLVLPSI